MFRWLAITLMSVMVLAVLALAVGGWRVQTALANRLEGLTEELSSLHRAQEKLLDRKPVETPKIEGRAYLGDTSHPAANTEVLIMNASNMKLFRRLWTDVDGRFRSNSLPEGDYFVLAPLLAAVGRKPLETLPGNIGLYNYLQSQPLYIYPGTEFDPLALDLRLDGGQVSYEIVGPDPRQNAGGPPIHYRSQFVLAPVNPPPPLPTDPNGENITKDWPLRGRSHNGPWSENSFNLAVGGSVNEPLRTYSMLLAGQYQAAMIVVVFVDFDSLADDTKEKSLWRNLQKQSVVGTHFYYPPYSQPEGFTAFEVTGGKRTHLRITISEALEARARELFAFEINDFKAQSEDAKAIQRATLDGKSVWECPFRGAPYDRHNTFFSVEYRP